MLRLDLRESALGEVQIWKIAEPTTNTSGHAMDLANGWIVFHTDDVELQHWPTSTLVSLDLEVSTNLWIAVRELTKHDQGTATLFSKFVNHGKHLLIVSEDTIEVHTLPGIPDTGATIPQLETTLFGSEALESGPHQDHIHLIEHNLGRTDAPYHLSLLMSRKSDDPLSLYPVLEHYRIILRVPQQRTEHWDRPVDFEVALAYKFQTLSEAPVVWIPGGESRGAATWLLEDEDGLCLQDLVRYKLPTCPSLTPDPKENIFLHTRKLVREDMEGDQLLTARWSCVAMSQEGYIAMGQKDGRVRIEYFC